MIYVDIDGIMRDLCMAVFGTHDVRWDHKVNGKNLIEIVDENPELLLTAPRARMFDTVVMNLDHIDFLSCQPYMWREATTKWIRKHLGKKYGKCTITYVDYPEEKNDYIFADDWLVDDGPKLKDYRRVILVDYPYNRGIKAPWRVETPTDLGLYLNRLKEVTV